MQQGLEATAAENPRLHHTSDPSVRLGPARTLWPKGLPFWSHLCCEPVIHVCSAGYTESRESRMGLVHRHFFFYLLFNIKYFYLNLLPSISSILIFIRVITVFLFQCLLGTKHHSRCWGSGLLRVGWNSIHFFSPPCPRAVTDLTEDCNPCNRARSGPS